MPSPLPYPVEEIEAFYLEHKHANAAEILLKTPENERGKVQWLLNQTASRKKVESKIPSLASRYDVVLSPVANLAQSSSEATARHKAQFVSGSLLDLTLGSGIDAWRMSANATSLTGVEPNESLAQITSHNLTALQVLHNVEITDAESYLANNQSTFNTIFLDPSRRSDDGAKTVALHRMQPDLTGMWETLLERGDQVIVKLSPLFDITAVIQQLPGVFEIRIVSLNNEVKELLIRAKKGYAESVQVIAEEIGISPWEYSVPATRTSAAPQTGEWQQYIYDPSPALIKQNAHDYYAVEHGLIKPIKDASIYTSNALLPDFPGRVFEVKEISKPYKINSLPKRLSIVTRYYFEKPEEIRKRLKVGESDTDFLFAIGKKKNERTFIYALRKS